MNSNIKSAGVANLEAVPGFYRVAIVGAGSLKGKDVAEVLEQRNFPSSEIKLLDDDEETGKLEAVKDEMTFIQSIRSEQFDKVDFTFFACDADSTRRNWKQVSNAGSSIVDLSYALESEAGAIVRAPWVERQLGQIVTPELAPGPVVAADPIAVVLALLILRVQAAIPVKRAVATVFVPVSEFGQKGMDELHEQTVNLLSFQQLPKDIFDVQVAFNMVSRYGDKAVSTLSSVTDRILRHYKKITADRAIVPSVQVVQPPIFHGNAVSLNLQLESAADISQISKAITDENISVTPTSEDAPSNVNAAAQGNILVALTPDAADASSVWLWAASDNLRVAASIGVELAESMAAARPRGKIQ